MKIKRERPLSKKYGGEQILQVFLTMIAWFGCKCTAIVGSFIAMTINIIVYYKIIHVKVDKIPEPDSSSPIVIFSSIFLFLDELRAFLV
jgi:hypothetical protein